MATSKSVSNRHLDKITGQLAFVKVLIFLIVILLIAVLVRADWKVENIQIIPTSKKATSSVFRLWTKKRMNRKKGKSSGYLKCEKK